MKGILKATVAVCSVLGFLGGCASTEKARTQFWPAPPDPPRVQYLKHVASSEDVVGKKAIKLLDMGQEDEKVVGYVKPYGIAVYKGVMYVCDTIQAQVAVMDLVNKKASYLSGNTGAGALKKPVNVATDSDGFLYVADTGRRQVLKYEPSGAFLRAIGGEPMKPVAVAVDDLYLYILDGANSVVELYDRFTSEPVRKFGQEGPEEGHLFSPLGLSVDGKGGVYVTNMDGRIVHFDRDGHPLRMFGKLGTSIAEFNRPRSITFDKDGIMYIVDAGNQEVRLLNDQFQLLMSFGAPGTPGSLNVPAGIAVSYDNLPYFQELAEPDFIVEKVIYVVSQFGADKVSIYGFGKKKGVDYDAIVKARLEEIRKKEEAVIKERKAQEEKEKQEKEKKESAGADAKTAGSAPSSSVVK